MLRTVDDCDKALKLLEIEREHILKIREFLEKNGDQVSPFVRPKLDRILDIVKNNPGIDGQKVRIILTGEGFIGRQAQSGLNYLSQRGRIENRGKHGLGARWYIVKATK